MIKFKDILRQSIENDEILEARASERDVHGEPMKSFPTIAQITKDSTEYGRHAAIQDLADGQLNLLGMKDDMNFTNYVNDVQYYMQKLIRRAAAEGWTAGYRKASKGQ